MESYDLTTGTFSGTSKKLLYFSIAAFIAGAAMLVAGSVMLGVGIHKYNQRVDAAQVGPPNIQTTTTGSSYTNLPLTTTTTTTPPSTDETPDILIMLDTSEVIGEDNFDEVKDYISLSIAPQLPLDGIATRDKHSKVGIVAFSSASVNIISYYEANDIATLQSAITSIPLSQASSPNPAKALNVMQKLEASKTENPNVMMVLASGTQSDVDAAAAVLGQFQTVVQNFTFVALGDAGKLDLSAIESNSNGVYHSDGGYQLSANDTAALLGNLNPANITAITPSPPPTASPPTCNKDIAILIDQSVAVGTKVDFKRQIDYLANTLAPTWKIGRSNIETMGILYSQLSNQPLPSTPFSYNSTQQFIADLNAVRGNNPLGYNDITAGLASLQSHLTNLRPTFELTTIIFTYNSDLFDIMNAVEEAKNIKGNIIVVAVNTDASNLYYLSGTVIQTGSFFSDNITQQINDALCAPPVSPSPLPTNPPTSSPSTTTQAPPPTCGNDVAILIDRSVAVGSVDDFNRQINFLTNQLVNTWTISLNDIETYAMLYSQLTSTSLSVKPFKYNTTQEFITDISAATNTTPLGYNDITAGLASLQSHLVNLRQGRNLSIILFTYKDDLFDVVNALPEAQNIGGNLIIVAVNTVVENLNYLSGTVIQTDKYFAWNLASQINVALCQAPVPPLPLPTDLPISTSPSSTIPSTPAPGDYYPCQSNIVFALDASSDMGDAEFSLMQELLTVNIVKQNWTIFERIGLISYADDSSCTYDYGTFHAKGDFDSTVNNISHFSNPNSITFGMGIIQSSFNYVPLYIQNTVFFTSTSDPGDVAKASQNSPIIDQKGALIVVAVHPAKKSDLLPLVNGDETKVFELSLISGIDHQTIADNILKKFYCPGFSSSTASPTTTTASSPASPTTTVTVPPTSPSTTVSNPASPTTTVTASPTSPTTSMSPETTLTTLPPSASTSTPYVPCQSWIHFGIDDSNVLSNQNFTNQLNFISTAIGQINHPERIEAYGAYDTYVSWKNDFTIERIQTFIKGISQSGPYILRNQFGNLFNGLKTIQPTSSPVGALIFISDTSDQALGGASDIFANITGAQITFVLLGPNADSSKLTQFSQNFIFWPDLSQPQPDNWNTLFPPAYGCSNVTTIPPTSPSPPTSPTTPSSSTTTVPTVTSPSAGTTPSSSTSPFVPSSTVSVTIPSSTTPSSYIPCQSWIHFGVDDANVLSNSNFSNQLNFISSAIGQINHPERLEVNSVYDTQVSWNSPLSIETIQNIVKGISQSGGPYSLRVQFGNLLNGLKTIQPTSTPVGALIFISDTSDQALVGANDTFSQISGAQITFVLLGNGPDQSKLTKYSNNFITWRDLSQSQPDNWDTLFPTAYRCSNVTTFPPTSPTPPSSPKTSPSSISSSPSPSVTSPAPSSSTTVPSVTSPSPVTTPSSSPSVTSPISTASTFTPYIPCQSWIHFGVDDSNQLNSSDNLIQLNFIASEIGKINHPERLEVNSVFDTTVSWNSGLSIPQIQNLVQRIPQSGGPYSLRVQFGNLFNGLQTIQPTLIPVGALIFISDTSAQALVGANETFNQLSGVKITFVLLGPNADSSKLTQFSQNFIYWTDLTQSQPSNWDTLFPPAYGCNNGISTPGSTTITSPQTSPSTTTSALVPTSTTPTQTPASSSTPSPTPPSSSTVTQTTSITTPGSTPSVPFAPCQSWIHFGVDDSNKLSLGDNQKQLNFISSEIGKITHPERLEVNSVYDTQVSWNNPLSIPQIQNIVQGISQSGPYSLRVQFGNLLNGLKTIQPTSTPVGALIFISDTSDGALNGANDTFNSLKDVVITFVLLGGDADQTKLMPYSTNFINWSDLSQSQPTDWNNLYPPAYGCNNGISTLGSTTATSPQTTSVTATVTVPSTTTSTSSSIPTSTITTQASTSPSTPSPSTTSTSPQTSSTVTQTPSITGSTPSTPYVPCQSWIHFGVDDSNQLSSSDNQLQLNFVASEMGKINHPERLEVNSVYDTQVLWNNNFNISQIQDSVKSISQKPQSYNLRQQFANLLNGFNSILPTSNPVGALIFISDTSDQVLAGAQDVFNQINGVQITFVLLGNGPDQNKLTNFSTNFIIWRDLSQTKPDNWDNLFPAAYGCTNVITLSSTPSTSITTPQMVSSSASPITVSSVPITTTQTLPSSSAPSSSSSTSSIIPSTLLSTGTTSIPPTGGPYSPCQVWITTLADNSKSLTVDEFQKQLNFLKDTLYQVTNYDRVRYGYYNLATHDMNYPWNINNNFPGLQAAIQNTTLTSYPAGLSNAMALLMNDFISNQTIPDSTLIFVSDTTNAIQINTALNRYNTLKQEGIRFTFILAGPNTDASQLQGFTDAIIYNWQNMSTSQPDGWDISQAFRCTPQASTTPGSTSVTVTQTTQSTATTPVVTTQTSPTVPSSTTFVTNPSSASPSSTTPSSYIPCQSWIHFGVDDSNVLSDPNFNNQLNFISTAIGSINHPERLEVNSVYDTQVLWNNNFNISQIQDSVKSISQKPQSYNLRQQFANLLNGFNSILPTSNPVGALIFISDTSDQALAGAQDVFNQLNGVQITFVILGSTVNSAALTNYSNIFITWSDLSQPQPDNWNQNVASDAYGCSMTSPATATSLSSTVVPMTSSSPSTVSLTRQPITVYTVQTITPRSTVSASTTLSSTQSTPIPPTGGPYSPCQVWITILADNSKSLTVDEFQKQLSFVKDTLNNVTIYDRVRYGYYNLANELMSYPWNSTNTFQGLQTAIDNTTLTSNPAGLPKAMALLTDNHFNQTIPDSTLIFVSDTTNAIQINTALNRYNTLKQEGIRFTFILAGPNTDASQLQGFTDAIIYNWQNMSTSQPDGWDISQAFRCTPQASTTPGLSTLSTITIPSSSPTSTTSQTPQTSLSSTTTPLNPSSTTPSSYIPCPSWISFGVDDSNTLNNTQFSNQLNFISSAIAKINHLERVQVVSVYDQQVTWNSIFNLIQFQHAVNGITQAGPYLLKNEFLNLLVNMANIQPNNMPIGALIFISDTSDAALAGADQIFPQIIGAQITFVLLGNGADQSKLTKYSTNFITWRDLSQSQPDNWDILSGTAYGCSNSQSTISAATTPQTSVTSQSTSTVVGSTSTIEIVSTSTVIQSTSTSVSIPSSSGATTYSSSSSPSAGTTSTPPTGDPYSPCQVWITTLADNSNSLTVDQFQKQLNFLKDTLNQIKNYDRVRYGYYNFNTHMMNYPWDPSNNFPGLKAAIENTTHTSNQAGLTTAMTLLVSNLIPNQTTPDSTLIFVSDTTNDFVITQAVNRYNSALKPEGIRLTFVLVGPKTDASHLSGFEDALIFNWQNTNNSQPDGWDSSQAFRCSISSSTSNTGSSSVATTTTPSGATSTLSMSPSGSTTASIGSSGSTSPVPYIPCSTWISFSYDDSKSLSNDDFRTQLSFVSTAISAINYPNRLRIQGAFTDIASWNSGQTIDHMKNLLSAQTQTSNSYSLLQEFANLVTSYQPVANTTNLPFGVLIFISDTSDDALRNAARLFPYLNKVKLTFVLLGSNVDSSKLGNFSSNFINWPNLNQSQPDNWDIAFFDAYGCNLINASTAQPSTTSAVSSTASSTFPPTSTASSSVSSTPAPSSTTISTTLPPTSVVTTPSVSSTVSTLPSSATTSLSSPTDVPYFPCPSWISFSYDDSSFLQYSDFQTQMNFISTAIGALNYPQRIRVSGAFTDVAPWNSGRTISQIQEEISYTNQTEIAYALLQEFAALVSGVNSLDNSTTWPIGAVIFIADTSDSALANAGRLLPFLTKVKITFIALGSADTSKLEQFSQNIISWPDLSQPQPPNWDTLYPSAYGCNNNIAFTI